MARMVTVLSVAGLLVVGLSAASCGGDSEPKIDVADGGEYSISVTAADFVAGIDNPWLPLVPGATWVYEGRDGDEVERIEIEVLADTRVIQGITATIVHDTVYLDGEVIEDTFDWYAQDVDGNVWYLGEDSTEYEDGKPVSKHGSWEWGVDGALPGIIMWADPQVGLAYRQEFYEGEAEDVAQITRLGDSASPAYGSLDDLLVISEWNPMEPDVVEEKFYARGIGVVLEKKVEGGSETVELISASVPG